MIRVLHSAGDMIKGGGIEAFLMNIYRNIDRKRVQFDFVCSKYCENSFQDEIISLGGKIYYLKTRDYCYRRNYNEYYNLLKKVENIQIVHVHVSSLMDISLLKAAYDCNIRTRIIHALASGQTGPQVLNLIHYYNQHRISYYATELFACSDLAGKYEYCNIGKRRGFTIINNGIETERFRFDVEARDRIRGEYGLEKSYVIGNVGRMVSYKNQMFMLPILKKVLESIPEAKLLIVGEGPLKTKIVENAQKLGIENQVILTGSRVDVNDLYSAMDVFLFPSIFEGFGIVLIEAQCSGLPCVVADSNIPSSIKLSDDLFFISLKDSTKHWAENIINLYKRERIERVEEAKNKGYDIKAISKWLGKFYLERGNI